MKTVQGRTKEYQLVTKTKQKDVDGVIYLVAGEKSLWVKLLKDRSAGKQVEIQRLIKKHESTGFDIPLEIVTDAKGFAGYTFDGIEMDVVPETTITKKKTMDTTLPRKNKKQDDFLTDIQDQPGYSGISQGISSGSQLLVLAIIGVAMTALTFLFLHGWVINFIYYHMSDVAGAGCQRLSIGGIVPSVVGLIFLIIYLKSLGKNIGKISVYVIAAVIAFLLGEVVAYGTIGILYVLFVKILGAIYTYQTVIITGIVLLILAKLLFPGFLKRR